MRQELKDFYILIVINNAKENINTFYDGYNTTKKQLELL